MCGQEMGAYKTFCIGPMCAITRTISEPPSHRDCLDYAVRACPFLTRPHAHRREAGLPEDAHDGAGLPIKRNPGVICLWTTKRYDVYRHDATDYGNPGVLITIGEPEAIEWWREGRPATRPEVEESVRTGLPLLEAEAREEDRQVRARPMGLRFSRERASDAAIAELARRLASVSTIARPVPASRRLRTCHVEDHRPRPARRPRSPTSQTVYTLPEVAQFARMLRVHG